MKLNLNLEVEFRSGTKPGLPVEVAVLFDVRDKNGKLWRNAFVGTGAHKEDALHSLANNPNLPRALTHAFSCQEELNLRWKLTYGMSRTDAETSGAKTAKQDLFQALQSHGVEVTGEMTREQMLEAGDNHFKTLVVAKKV